MMNELSFRMLCRPLRTQMCSPFIQHDVNALQQTTLGMHFTLFNSHMLDSIHVMQYIQFWHALERLISGCRTLYCHLFGSFIIQRRDPIKKKICSSWTHLSLLIPGFISRSTSNKIGPKTYKNYMTVSGWKECALL